MDVDKEILKLSWPAYAGLLTQTGRSTGIGHPRLKKYYFSKKNLPFNFDERRNEDGLFPR